MDPGNKLFRDEVVLYQADRLSGDAAIAVPIAWQVIGFLIFSGFVIAFLFLFFASYSRVETANGAIVPDLGIVAIVPARTGVITELFVREGSMVRADAKLATIRTEEDGGTMTTAADRIEAAIGKQDESISARFEANTSAVNARMMALTAQISGLKDEIDQLESQIKIQLNLVGSAQKALELTTDISKRGFISKRDLQIREELFLSRQQNLAQLKQALASRRSSYSATSQSMAEVAAQSRAQNAQLANSRAEVMQAAVNASAFRSYVIRAPVAGKITALTARAGQSTSSQGSLMTVIPAGSELRAELSVPSSAIGFIKAGQDVRIAIDAFPYQRFGTVGGKVLNVSSSALSQSIANGRTTSVYPVTVALEDKSVYAYGARHLLVPGMTLTARIIAEKQTLLEWLFEPLFAVRMR